jgi:hypothetical protein
MRGGLAKSAWFVITHAKIHTVLTSIILAAVILGTRQIYGLYTLTIAPTSSAIGSRSTSTDYGPDITLTQPLWSKVLKDAPLDTNQVFILLNLWIVTSVVILCLCVSVTIAKAYSGTSQPAPSSEVRITLAWLAGPGALLRGIQHCVMTIINTVLMAPKLSRRTFSWKRTTSRLVFFLVLLSSCVLLLRQALSLVYVAGNNTSTSFSDLPDIAKTQATLSDANTSPLASFMALNAIIAFIVLVLLGGWYALVDARTRSSTGNRSWKLLLQTPVLRYVAAVTIIITFALVMFFFPQIVAYNNTALSKLSSDPGFIALNIFFATYTLPLLWALFELWDLAVGIWGASGFPKTKANAGKTTKEASRDGSRKQSGRRRRT